MSLPKVALSLPIIWLLGSELNGKVPSAGLEVSGLQGDLNPTLFDQVKWVEFSKLRSGSGLEE